IGRVDRRLIIKPLLAREGLFAFTHYHRSNSPMSPQAGELLVQEIAPRIRSSLSHCVSQVGPEDIDELVQDAIATAAKLLHSVETRAKKVTAGNISYYAGRLTREGRRSTGFKKTHPLHPGTQIAARFRVGSLRQPICGEN